MFEAAELGHTVDKETYARTVPDLRADLLDTQYALHEDGRFPVIALMAGLDGAGKGETVNVLNAWMDPRHIRTVAFGPPAAEETARPQMWRYWMALPPKGRLGIMFGSWYTDPILRRLQGASSRPEFDAALARINSFEQLLAAEGALILKFWLHLSKRDLKRRLTAIDRDPRRTWRVTKVDWKQYKHYGQYYRVAEHALRSTSSAHAPWIVVEGADERYRHLTVGKILLDTIRARLAIPKHQDQRVAAAAPRLLRPIDQLTVLDRLDLSRVLPDKTYKAALERWQGALNKQLRHKKFDRISVIAAFEGMDAAGKGGAIRRITGALDARQYHVIPIAAPTDEERAHPYLWRFWRHLPRRGRLTIYDRSWYGRVLVERVEGLCAAADWMRAYVELNEFEAELTEAGAVVVKYWLQISPAEQLRRFKAREQTRFKRFKITAEDWRNRDKWDDYQRAAADMIERTATPLAPWTLVEANDKNWARIKILKTLVKAIERALDAV